MIKKNNIILLFYVSLLVIGIILKENFSSFNYIYLIVGVVVLLITSTYNKRPILDWGVLSILLTLVLFAYKMNNWRYYLIDVANLFVFFSLLDTIYTRNNSVLFNRSKIIFISYILLYFILDFAGLFITENGRYAGLLGSINVSATIIVFMLIFLSEYLLFKNSLSIKKYWLLVTGFVLLIILSGSRSLLLALPYWIYIIYLLIKPKSSLYKFLSYCVVFIILIGFVFFFNFDKLLFDLRFNEDDLSIKSRSNIQLIIINKIIGNYLVIPSGFHDAYNTISLDAGKDFPVHNDILNYWNDWGVVFLLFVTFVVKYIKKFNLHILLILLVYVGACLHNLMFSIPLLLPFIMSLKLASTDRKMCNAPFKK